MVELTEKVERLETILGQFIVNTNLTIKGIDRMIEELKSEGEMRIKGIDRMIEELKSDGEKDRGESAQMRKEMNRKWGELANKMGTLVEDIVAPNLPRIARQYFGCEVILDFMERRKRVHPTDHSKQREFDVLCVGEKVVLWNETKATARQDYIDGFVAALPEFFEYFPDYGGRTLIPIFASLHLSAETIQYLTQRKVYGLAMGDETMELVNYRELTPDSAGR